MSLDDVKFYAPEKRTTSNARLIRKAFREGFKQGVAFLNESDSNNSARWWNEAFLEFCKKNKIKV